MGPPKHGGVEDTVAYHRCHAVAALPGFSRPEDEAAGNALGWIDHDGGALGGDLNHGRLVSLDANPVIGIPPLLGVRPYPRPVGDAACPIEVLIGGIALVGDPLHDPIELTKGTGVGFFHPGAGRLHPPVEVVQPRLLCRPPSGRRGGGSSDAVLEVPPVLIALSVVAGHPASGFRIQLTVPLIEEGGHLGGVHPVAVPAVPRP